MARSSQSTRRDSLRLVVRAAVRAGKRLPRPRKPKDDGTAAAPATPDPTPMPSMGGAEAPLD